MKTLRKTALTRTIEGYAGRSSIHGIGYVFDRDINIVDRLLWLFVVIAFIGGAAMLTWNFWSQFSPALRAARTEQPAVAEMPTHSFVQPATRLKS